MKILNSKFQEYLDKRISLEELKNIILERIFLNKAFFGFNRLSDDHFSDFLIYIIPRLKKIVEKFNPEKSSFSTYLRASLLLINKTWYFQIIRKEAEKSSIKSYVQQEYTDVVEEEIPDFDTDYQTDAKNEILRISHGKRIPVEKKILLLALKSSFYLTPSHITKICKTTGISEENFLILLDKTKKSMKKKIDKNQAWKEQNNKIYILKKRYKKQLKRLSSDTCMFCKVQKSLNYVNHIWEKRLNENRMKKITPSNQIISELLDIPVHSINLILKEVQENYKPGMEV